MICNLVLEVLTAWSFHAGDWVPVELCVDTKEDTHFVRRKDTNETCNIYQAVVPNLGAIWVIEEEK